MSRMTHIFLCLSLLVASTAGFGQTPQKRRETPLFVRVIGNFGERGEEVADRASRCEIYASSVVMIHFLRDKDAHSEHVLETRTQRGVPASSLQELQQSIADASEEKLEMQALAADSKDDYYYAHKTEYFKDLVATVKVEVVTLRRVEGENIQLRIGQKAAELRKYIDDTCASVGAPNREWLENKK